LRQKQYDVGTELNAKKEPIQIDRVWDLIGDACKIIVGSGRKSIEFNPATADREEILKRVTGRTGNLRAPTLRVADVIYVGFNEEMYESLE
jgi:hypothetical protein